MEPLTLTPSDADGGPAVIFEGEAVIDEGEVLDEVAADDADEGTDRITSDSHWVVQVKTLGPHLLLSNPRVLLTAHPSSPSHTPSQA